MRGSFDRFPRRASLIVPPNPALQHRHPMANGLRQLWLPEWTRGQDRLRNLVRTSGESQVADFTPTAPTWTTGVSGAALAFDGTAKQLLHSAPPASLWNPGLGGLAYTIAFIGRIKSHPGGGRILYSHNQSTSGVRSIEISASSTDLQFFVTQDSGTTEKVSATLTTIPAIGSLFAVIATIRDGTTSAIAMRDFQAGTRGTATNTAGTITAATVTTIDQESFCSWHGGGTATDFADADMAGAFGWGRAFTDADMQAWLDDPFGVVTPRRAPAYIGPGSTALGVTLSTQWTVIPATASLWTFADAFVTFDNPAFLFDGGMAVAGGSAAAGVTLTTQWTVLGGQPAATATAPSAGTLTTTWTLFPNRQLGGLTLPTQWSVSTSGTAASGAAAAGQTLTTSWTVFPGAAGGFAAAAGAGTLTTTWSVSAAGTASGATQAAAGKLITTTWTVVAGTVSTTPPPVITRNPYSTGSGFGPGGDPESAARIRSTVERAAHKAFDPLGWSQEQVEKAAQAMRDALREENEATRPERVKRAVSRFLGLADDD
jgi:hypothetical protein